MSIVDDNAPFEDMDKQVMEELTIPKEDAEGTQLDPEDFQIQVTLEEIVEANYQAIKVVFASAIAQILGGDALTAKRLFTQIEQDVEQHRIQFLMMAQGYREAVDEVAAEIIEETDEDNSDELRGSEEAQAN